MLLPIVAIVGSVDDSRQRELTVTNPAQARRACAELGTALAKAGWELAVYSSKPVFVEADVVGGYVASGHARKGSVHVFAPIGKANFPEQEDFPEIFRSRPDASPDWEVAFFRSLSECQGVLLVGGGRSTLATGAVAVAMRLSLVSVASFGGSARKVWERFSNDEIANKEQRYEMGRSWDSGSAVRLVAVLDSQYRARLAEIKKRARRAATEVRRQQVSLTLALAFLLAAFGGLAGSWSSAVETLAAMALLICVPLLAGASGGLIRNTLTFGRARGSSCVLGAVAGGITGVLYVASQLVGAPAVLNTDQIGTIQRLLFFVLPLGFVAGLTFDSVYARLRGTDVSQSQTLATIAKASPTEPE